MDASPSQFATSDRGLAAAVAWLGIAGGISVVGGYVVFILMAWLYWGPYIAAPDWTALACFGAPHVVLGGIGIVLGTRARHGRLHPVGLGITGLLAMPAGFFFLGGLPTFSGGILLLVAAVFAIVEDERIARARAAFPRHDLWTGGKV